MEQPKKLGRSIVSPSFLYGFFAISYLLSGAVDPALVWPPPAPGLVGPRHQGVLLSPSVFP